MTGRNEFIMTKRHQFMTLEELIIESARVADEKGWWPDGDRNFGEALALMHSELSEALDEWRSDRGLFYTDEKGKPQGVLVEFADTFIRMADMIGHLTIPYEFEKALRAKMAYNETREHRHGNKKA
jgi:hypothetical protein